MLDFWRRLAGNEICDGTRSSSHDSPHQINLVQGSRTPAQVFVLLVLYALPYLGLKVLEKLLDLLLGVEVRGIEKRPPAGAVIFEPDGPAWLPSWLRYLYPIS